MSNDAAFAALRAMAELAEKASTFEEWERIFWAMAEIGRAAGLEMFIVESVNMDALVEAKREREERAVRSTAYEAARPGRRSKASAELR